MVTRPDVLENMKYYPNCPSLIDRQTDSFIGRLRFHYNENKNDKEISLSLHFCTQR